MLDVAPLRSAVALTAFLRGPQRLKVARTPNPSTTPKLEKSWNNGWNTPPKRRRALVYGNPRKWQNGVLVLLLRLERGLEQASNWR
jgi:hypothetical protein